MLDYASDFAKQVGNPVCAAVEVCVGEARPS